jgi:hypothetical protein
VEHGLLDEAVQERPERPVREAVVVVLDLAAAELDAAELGRSAVTSPPAAGLKLPRLPETGSRFA